jgi:enoyl-CoA hydratase/carnithine racemase
MSHRVTITEENQIATVTLNRADKRNALDLDMINGIVDAGEALRDRRDIRAVILTGDGPAFCAGLDLNGMPEIAKVAQSGEGITARTHGISNLFQQAGMVWSEIPMPVIAAIHGYAFGGGFQIMLGADIRIAAPDTQFSIMESRWGLVPDMSGLVNMRHLMPMDVIRMLTYTGEKFDADRALGWGVVTELNADPLARASELATTIANKNPDAMRQAKRMITETMLASPADVLMHESMAQQALIGTENQMEAVMSQMQKRPANFKD